MDCLAEEFKRVVDLLERFGRPMTPNEIVLGMSSWFSERSIYRQINSGLKHRVLLEIVIDLRPSYRKKVRLIALNFAGPDDEMDFTVTVPLEKH